MKQIIKNPLFSWLKWIPHYFSVKRKNPTLILENMAYVKNSSLGLYNIIYQNSSLINSFLGDYSYLNKRTNVSNAKIGKYCSIGENVTIGLGKHPTSKFISTHPTFYTNKYKHYFSKKLIFEEYEEINIGNDVWIGSNSILRDGLNIGDGAIIATGSIVVKDVPSYAIVGGNPAKIIRYRFEEHQVKLLLEIAWWNKPVDWIAKNAEVMIDIDLFLNAVSKEK